MADASVILRAYFPDEATPQAQQLMLDYARGQVNLYAPRLLFLELFNAILVAARRGRIDRPTLHRLAEEVSLLQIGWVDVENHGYQILALGKELSLTSYDASYVLSAQLKGCRLVTADQRLYNATRHRFPFVLLLENYQKAKS